MRFEEMKYLRPDVAEIKGKMKDYLESLKTAATYEEVREIFINKDKLDRKWQTQASLAHIRHSIDTTDAFYEEEEDFWNMTMPELQECEHAWNLGLLDCAFRPQLEEEFGAIIFNKIEMDLKSFSPGITEEAKQENVMVTEYEKLLASAQIPFEGGSYTIAQMTPFKNDADDNRRLAAWKAEGQWYKDNQDKLDELYDKLTHLRDTMGRKMGYDGYMTLGYNRMGRNCYTKEDLAVFRDNVVKYLVPVAEEIYRDQAKRLGKSYPMSFADNALEFRSGNPKPVGEEADVVAAGKKFYDELSPETSQFFRMMIDDNLMDLASKKGKAGGGYCTSIPDYDVPFIFANFNGTQGDVEVVTHEAGHAFAEYMNRERVPLSVIWPSMEACEVHSMSMEFFGEMYAEDFFGADAEKFLYSHLAGAIKFIPYGTMVDHYQHIVYEKPELTPAERHAEWKRLMGIYMPWQRLDGEIPFYSEGEAWQRQHHIYSLPFYYIDYCLAQTVALQFWAMIQKNRADAWKHYMRYTKQGGTVTFIDLLKNAGLQSPFDEECLRGVCEAASEYLKKIDTSNM